MSSMRRTILAPTFLAQSQVRRKVRAFPRWSAPVGEGARRVLGSRSLTGQAIIARGIPVEGFMKTRWILVVALLAVAGSLVAGRSGAQDDAAEKEKKAARDETLEKGGGSAE